MRGALRFVGWTAAGLLVLGGLARLLLFEPWTIPDDALLGASIQPTLAAGDTVLVLTVGTPSFGDLVRCPDPEEPSRWVVGRIAGEEGDTVHLRGPLLSVNGKSYTSTEACKDAVFTVVDPDTGHELEMRCDRVGMGAGWHFRGHSSERLRREEVEKQVGEGKIYLLSDNRDIHDDSRDFGTLDANACQDRIVFRLWSRDGWQDVEGRMTVIR